LSSQEETPSLSGAGGNWRVIDEVVDPTVIQQQDRLSCGPACAETLLRERGINNITQAEIAALSGTPVSVPDLTRALNQLAEEGSSQWMGGYLDIPGTSSIELLEVLISTGTWIAELREPGARLGHLVVVDGCDALGRICIRDPWDGTKYKMEPEEFWQYWTQMGIYVRES